MLALVRTPRLSVYFFSFFFRPHKGSVVCLSVFVVLFFSSFSFLLLCLCSFAFLGRCLLLFLCWIFFRFNHKDARQGKRAAALAQDSRHERCPQLIFGQLVDVFTTSPSCHFLISTFDSSQQNERPMYFGIRQIELKSFLI
jgi:hypothetical protein